MARYGFCRRNECRSGRVEMAIGRRRDLQSVPAWSKEEDEALKTAIAKGFGLQRLSARFNKKPELIAKRASQLGLTIKEIVRPPLLERKE